MKQVFTFIFSLTWFWSLPALANIDCQRLLGGLPSKIVITEKSKKHIWDGNYGLEKGESVIKGGMHSLQGLDSFLEVRPDIFQLGTRRMNLRNGNVPKMDWYHTSVNQQNGVIHLQLPESAFKKNQRQQLLDADIQAQGAYLWKTVFPERLTWNQLVERIEYLFKNPENVQFRGQGMVLMEGDVPGVYGLKPFKLKMLFHRETGELISAYPSFLQSGGVHGPTAILKNFKVNTLTPMFQDKQGQDVEAMPQEFQDFVREVQKLTNMEIHNPSRFKKKNFEKWNTMKAAAKERAMALFYSESRHVTGSVSVIELLSHGLVPDYQRESLTRKTFEVVEAVFQDSSMSVRSRLDFILDMIVNQRVFGIRPVEDIIFGKFLFAKAFQLMRRVEPGYQSYALRMMEKSPIHFLNLIHFPKGSFTSGDPHKMAGEVTAALSLQMSLGDEYYHGDQPPSRFFFEYAKEVAGSEWLYFELLGEVESFQPGFVTGNFLRVKYFADFLNSLSMLASTADLVGRVEFPQVTVYGKRLRQRDIRPLSTRKRVLRDFRRHKYLIQKLVFEDKGATENWYRFVEMASRFDVDRLKVLAEVSNYEFEETIWTMLEELGDLEQSVALAIFPELQLVVLKKEKALDFRQKLFLLQYRLDH